jgi:hypothetical protein
MGRRTTPSKRMQIAIDNKSAIDFAWALLEICRIEYKEQGKFVTLSSQDIKNILQAILAVSSDTEGDSKTATIHEIKKYLNV